MSPLLSTVMEAIAHLASFDGDHASEKNEVGFNGTDTNIGHSLHRQPSWTRKQAMLALSICERYSKTQLRGFLLPTRAALEAEIGKAETERAKAAVAAAAASPSTAPEWGLQWGPHPRLLQTSKGLHSVRGAAPTPAFWDAWRADKEALRAKDYSVSQFNGKWTVSHWELLEAPKAPGTRPEAYGTLRPLKFPGGYKPWQPKAVQTLVADIENWPGAIDASETGVGKTFQALGVVREFEAKNVLVIVRRRARTQWEEAAKLMGVHDRCIFATIELIRRGKTQWGSWIVAGKDKIFQWSSVIDFLIIDEVHWCSGVKTQNGLMLRAATRQQIRTIGLSATAADSPLKMRALGEMLGLHNGKDFYSWVQKYGCRKGWHGGFEFDSKDPHNVKLMSKLHGQIFPKRGIRLRKSELGDSFPKTLITAELVDTDKDDGSKSTMAEELKRRDEVEAADLEKETSAYSLMVLAEHLYVEMTARATEEELTILRREIDAESLRETSEGDPGVPPPSKLKAARDACEATRTAHANIKSGKAILERLRLRQRVEILCIPAIVEMVEDAVEEGNRVAVFLSFKESIEALKKLLKDFNPGVIVGASGGQAERDVKKAQADFQADAIPVVICSEAGGESINLHGKDRLALIVPNDSVRKMTQIFGRVHRAGGEYSVQRILCPKGIGERVYANFKSKESMLNALNDGDLSKVMTDDDLIF